MGHCPGDQVACNSGHALSRKAPESARDSTDQEDKKRRLLARHPTAMLFPEAKPLPGQPGWAQGIQPVLLNSSPTTRLPPTVQNPGVLPEEVADALSGIHSPLEMKLGL